MAKYFSNDEVKGLDQRLVILLDQLRDRTGIPLIITSGLRTAEQNEATEGVAGSAHTKGLAADIRCHDSVARYKIVKAAYEVGFRRIEVATLHIHVDVDESKAQDVLWLGISK